MQTPRRSRRLAGLEPDFEAHRSDVPFLVASGDEGLSECQIATAVIAVLLVVPLVFFAAFS